MRTLRYVCLFAALLIHGLAVEQQNLQLASFDRVWNTVHDSHWDQEKVGAAWDRARTELRPQAELAHSAAEVRPVIAKLLRTLGESHFSVIPAEAYAQLHDGSADGTAAPDFDFRILDGEAVVTRPAGEVKSGWLLRRIQNQDVLPLLAKIREAIPNSREARLFGYALLMQRMSGAPGAIKSLTFLTGTGDSKTIEVSLRAPQHVAQFGNLPPFSMNLDWRISGNIGYFRFNAFFDPAWLQQQLGAAVQECAHCDGFILDLRGNLGGIVGLASAAAAWFVDKQTALGTQISKTAKLKLAVFPRAQRYTGKLAVLVDSLTVSSAEFLAAGLKDLGRARLFGEGTQGAALPSLIEKLPNGDRFQYAIADYVSASGAVVEGAGVTPDVTVRPNRNDYLAGRDPALDAARQWINTKE